MSILETHKKINIAILLVISLVLALVLTLGIIKLYAFSTKKVPVRIDSAAIIVKPEAETPAGSPSTGVNSVKESTQVVASKAGKKYHLLTCPGAKSILEKNKVFFKNRSEAEIAGYTPASNCKGLGKP